MTPAPDWPRPPAAQGPAPVRTDQRTGQRPAPPDRGLDRPPRPGPAHPHSPGSARRADPGRSPTLSPCRRSPPPGPGWRTARLWLEGGEPPSGVAATDQPNRDLRRLQQDHAEKPRAAPCRTHAPAHLAVARSRSLAASLQASPLLPSSLLSALSHVGGPRRPWERRIKSWPDCLDSGQAAASDGVVPCHLRLPTLSPSLGRNRARPSRTAKSHRLGRSTLELPLRETAGLPIRRPAARRLVAIVGSLCSWRHDGMVEVKKILRRQPHRHGGSTARPGGQVPAHASGRAHP